MLSAILTFTSLGVAVWALQAADWVNPQPSFLLTLALGVSSSALIAWKRLKGHWAFVLMAFGGLAVAIWQSVALFPAGEGSSFWSRWFEAVTQPSASSIGFVVFLLVVCWLAGAIGAWFAIRRGNGWLALAFGSLIVILNLVNLPRDFAFVLPLYLALGLMLVIQARWRRGEGASGGRKIRVFAGLGLSTIIILGAFGLPESPAEKLNLNIDGGSLYSAIKHNALNIFSAVPSKVKTVRSSGQEAVSFSGIPDQSDAVRFIINSPTPGYFQTRHYDIYAASGWSNGPLTDREIASGQTIADAVQLSKALVVRYEVENAVKTDLILINGQLSTLSIPVITRSLMAPVNGDIMAVVSSRLLTPYQPYTVTAHLSAATAADLAVSGNIYPAWISERYLQLPANLPRSVIQLSSQLTRGLNSGYYKVLAIKRYLQGLGYDNNGTDVLEGTDGVAYFLSTRQGNCVNFASALVVMLRSVGVPARFCQGYLGAEVDDEEKHLLIRGKDSHAWAEVYFPEYGWIVVEATPGRPADNFDPSLPLIPGEIFPPAETPTPIVPGSETNDSGIIDGDDVSPNNPISSEPWAAILAAIMLGLTIVFGASGTIYFNRASNPSAMYTRLGLIGKLFRLPPHYCETPLEYAHRLGKRLPAEAVDIHLVATAFAKSRYSPEKIQAKQDRAELSRLWRNLSRRLLRRRFGLGTHNY